MATVRLDDEIYAAMAAKAERINAAAAPGAKKLSTTKAIENACRRDLEAGDPEPAAPAAVDPPKRRRHADAPPAPTPDTCTHPRDQLEKHPWGNVCGLCKKLVK